MLLQLWGQCWGNTWGRLCLGRCSWKACSVRREGCVLSRKEWGGEVTDGKEVNVSTQEQFWKGSKSALGAWRPPHGWRWVIAAQRQDPVWTGSAHGAWKRLGVDTSHFLTRRGQRAGNTESQTCWKLFPDGPPDPRCTPSHPLLPALPAKSWALALLHVESWGVMWKRLLPTHSLTSSFTFPS